MPSNNPILCRHLLVSHNLTQFWHYSSGDNIRSHMTPSRKVSPKNLSCCLCFSQLAVHRRSSLWLGPLLEKPRACREVLYTLILAYSGTTRGQDSRKDVQGWDKGRGHRTVEPDPGIPCSLQKLWDSGVQAVMLWSLLPNRSFLNPALGALVKASLQRHSWLNH